MIYLASQSSRRKQILKRMKIPFIVIPSAYRERKYKTMAPEELVLRHARGKVLKSRYPLKARFILGADTIVWNKRAYGKPKTYTEAGRMIKSLSGKTHQVYTGLVLWDRRSTKFYQAVAKTDVKFKKLELCNIRKYLSLINPFDKAGSYAIQDGPKIVESICGSYSNVVGLPRKLLRKLIKQCGQ